MANDNTFSTVEKPPFLERGGKKYKAIEDAIVATLNNGKAVRVDLNGKDYRAMQNTIRINVQYRAGASARVHIKRDGPDAFIAWVEATRPIEPVVPHGTGGT